MSVTDRIIAKVNKDYPGLLIMGSELAKRELGRAPTGSLAYDLMLGGGWPLNQWNEIVGLESSGKTTMALKTVAMNQFMNPQHYCLWIASEAFNANWAAQLGVDLARVYVIETNVTEKALQIVLDFLKERWVDAVVIDSLPALVSDQELTKEMDDSTVAVNARLIGSFFRKEGAYGRRSLTDLDDRPFLGLIVNQWRDRVGVIRGDPKTTPGGKAKNYSFWTRVEVSRKEWIEEGSGDNAIRVGQITKARVLKNKSFPPQRTAQVDFYFDDNSVTGKGDYDRIKELANIAIAADVVEAGGGGWYHYNGSKWKGKDAFYQALRGGEDGDITMQHRLDAEVRRVVLHES
jgi:recombination protein RecA